MSPASCGSLLRGGSSEEDEAFGMNLLQETLAGKYIIAHRTICLSPWVAMRRQRVFIWRLHRSFCTPDDASVVGSFADDLVQRRMAAPPKQLAEFFIKRHDPAWFGKIECDVLSRGQCRETSQRPSAKAAWEKEVAEVRKRLREAGRPWFAADPLRRAKFHGLPSGKC